MSINIRAVPNTTQISPRRMVIGTSCLVEKTDTNVQNSIVFHREIWGSGEPIIYPQISRLRSRWVLAAISVSLKLSASLLMVGKRVQQMHTASADQSPPLILTIPPTTSHTIGMSFCHVITTSFTVKRSVNRTRAYIWCERVVR